MANLFPTPKISAALALALILVLYLGLALTISRIAPFNRGNDEGSNLRHIEFIMDKGRLSTSYEERDHIGQGANMPALVHLYLAWLSRGLQIDPLDSPVVKIYGDAFRYRLLDVVPERAGYLPTEDQFWPPAGLYLVLQVGRWSSIIINAATILVVAAVALEFKPAPAVGRPVWLAVAAAAILAFTPTFIFMSSLLNEDAMVALTMAIYFWMLIRVLKQPQRLLPLWIMGLALGVSLTAKYTSAVVPLELLLVFGWFAWLRSLGWLWFLQRISSVGLACLLAAGWWYGWNIWYLNDIKNLGWLPGLTRPFLTGGTDETTAQLGYWLSSGQIGEGSNAAVEQLGSLPDWLYNMALLVWGLKLGDNVPWFPFIYLFILVLMGLVLFGLWRLWRVDRASRQWLLLMILHLALFLLLPLLRFALTRDVGETAQGRHLLIPAAAPFAILLVWGLAAAIPGKWQPLAFITIITIFAVWTIAHAYRLASIRQTPLPMRTLPQAAGWLPETLNASFDDNIELVSYDLKPEPDQGVLYVELAWRALAPVNQNYLLELVLSDTHANEVRSHWIGYNGAGRVPTLAWEAGDVIYDRLGLPLLNLPAGEYSLAVKLLNPYNGQPNAAAVAIPLHLEQQTSQPANQQRQEGLVYSLWRASGPVADSLPGYRYPATISVVSNAAAPIYLVDEAGNEIEATRHLGELHHFVIGPRWKSGVYRIAGVTGTGNKLLSEPALTVENWWQRSFERPDDIEVSLDVNFANEITLLGYKLPQQQAKSGEAFTITFYWQAPAQRAPQADFVQFNHLLDSEGNLRGGYDRYPLENYNTLLWAPGEIVVDRYAVPVDDDAPAGDYYLNVGFYLIVGESAVNLPQVIDGEMSDITSVTIGPLHVVQ